MADPPAELFLSSLRISDEATEAAVEACHKICIAQQAIIPEVELRHLARHGGDSTFFEATLQAVIATAASAQLSESHAAAACDAIRACLTRCEESGEAEIRALAYSPKIWVDVFEVFLTSSDSRKPKPLKLLLTSLERSLSGNIFKPVKDDLKAYVSSRVWQAIGVHSGGGAVKPALQALRHLLSKSVIQAQDIISAIFHQQIRGSQERPESHDSHNPPTPSTPLSTSQFMQYSHHFLYKVLSWTSYPDTAPIAGRLVSTFSFSLRAWLASLSEPATLEYTSDENWPFWMSSFKKFLKTHPDSLGVLANHVFPELVRQDRKGWESFVQNVKPQTAGYMTDRDPVDLKIHLLLIRAIIENGSSKSIDSRAVEMIGADLLCHANPHIRSAAFSFVINASPLKEPLTKTTLNSLRFALPSYHAEVDPNLRQDNVAMIKKMILRLTTTLRASKSTATTSVAKRPLAEQARRGAPAASEFDFGSQIYGEHRLFFAWYLGFLTQELGPTASYQRHLVSLRVLGFLFSKSPYARQLFIEYKFNDSEGRDCCFVSEAELTTSLHELLLDPFEDVRELAASFLESSRESPWTVKTMLSSERPTFLVTQPTDVEEAPLWLDEALRTRTLHRAVAKMQSTGRADHADGFGRLYDILNGRHGKSAGGRPSNDEPHFVLRDIISILGHCAAIAQTDIYLAVKTASLHGYLIAARYLLVRYNHCGHTHIQDVELTQAWREISHRFLTISVQVWEAVKPILCADAPEGFEITKCDEPGIGTKDLISYCWRALKESSTLMHAMIAGSKHTPITHILQHEYYRDFGELAFQQLAELRHRGAFSTVSDTFAACCLRCAQSEDSRTRVLPRQWYQKTLLCIQQRGSALTRRSAGLPAMITSILAAYPEGDFFDEVVQDLQAVANKGPESNNYDRRLELPQVHAFNCLKDIFTESKFGGAVEQHMSVSLEIAVGGLESEQWAIRNCALMLLKALIARLNDGTNTTSSQVSSSHRRLSSIVYDKYPNLPKLLLRLLEPEDAVISKPPESEAKLADTSVLRAQRVFPALEIIEQSGIPKQHREKICRAVWSHLEGSIWPIREKAAKALSYLPVGGDIEQQMKQYLQHLYTSQNALHGRLLYLRYLVARLEPLTQHALEHLVTGVLDHFQDMITINCCAITRSSYISLVADILEAPTDHDKLSERSMFDPETNGHAPNSLNCSEKFLADNRWRIFAEYLRQACQAKPSYALEDAAKFRCRSLVSSLTKAHRNETSSRQCFIPSISTDHGSCRIAQTPEQSDQILRGTGSRLARSSTNIALDPVSRDGTSSYTVTDNESLDAWARALKLALDDNADVSTRQAAVDSLADYFEVIKDIPCLNRTSPLMLNLYLVLYDSLLDNDEDVRNRGAATASKLLSSTASQNDNGDARIPLVVPAARHKLLKWLKHHYHISSDMWMECLQRVLGVPALEKAIKGNRLPSPRRLLEDVRREDIALFVEEKQNLYIDEAQEAGVWQKVLLGLDRSSVNLEVVYKLRAWALEGVHAVTEVSKGEEDGPLGWTSKPDVFTLGTRIILAAEAVLYISRHEGVDIDVMVLRENLQELFLTGEMCDLRPAWMRMLRDILGGIIEEAGNGERGVTT